MGEGKLLDGVDSGRQGGNAGGVNVVAEEVQVGVAKLALLSSYYEVVLLQALEKRTEMSCMGEAIGAGNEDVI